MIVAMSDNQVIGVNNQLPWHLPNDLKHFKALTMGKPIVMGRKTYESIGRALPGRRNIILSTNRDLCAPGCEVMHSVDQIMAFITDPEIMIIGGATIYDQFLEVASTLYLTQVHTNIIGDVYFPDIKQQKKHWRELTRERFEADQQHAFAYTFLTLTGVENATHPCLR